MDRSPLFERDTELAAIGCAVDDVVSAGSLVYLAGAAGLGKSRLIEAARVRAADAGLLVLKAQGHELEQGFSFGLARQLFAPHVPVRRPARERLLSGAAAAAGPLLDGGLVDASGTQIGSTSFRHSARCCRL